MPHAVNKKPAVHSDKTFACHFRRDWEPHQGEKRWRNITKASFACKCLCMRSNVHERYRIDRMGCNDITAFIKHYISIAVICC